MKAALVSTLSHNVKFYKLFGPETVVIDTHYTVFVK